MLVDGGDHVGSFLQHYALQDVGSKGPSQRQIRPLKGDARHFYPFTVQQFISSRVASASVAIKALIYRFHTVIILSMRV